MSIYNYTYQGFFSGSSNEQKDIFSMKLDYYLNKISDFRFHNRLHSNFILQELQKYFGIRLGWFIFYQLLKIREKKIQKIT